MTIDLAEIKAALAAATPGPWRVVGDDLFIFGPGSGQMIASTDDDGELLIRGVGARLPMEDNAHLIAHAPEWLRALLEEVEALRAAMPTDEEIDDIREGIYGDDRMPRHVLNDALSALARIDAARGKDGE